jgi:putative transposase
MSYDPERHHRRSIRLHNYDYSSAGAYFVTILIKDRECLLGEVVDGEMRLSEMGEVVRAIWESLPERYPGVELDESMIMPNHMHGIIVITSEAEQAAVKASDRDVRADVAQERRRMLLPKIIGYFKMNTAKRANQIRSMPGAPFWQRDYYEHVIRDEADLRRIRDYIASNPLKWELDQIHPDNPSKW